MEADVLTRLEAALGSRVERDVRMSNYTTYRVGGRAAVVVTVDGSDDLAKVHACLADRSVSVLVLGRGSNLLVSDAGFEGVVIRWGAMGESIELPGNESATEYVTVGAGALLPIVARRTAHAGLTGFEWAVGVPGSVGGAVRMNAGGHGSDIAASLVDVEIFDLTTGRATTRSASELGLRFRGSNLHDTDVVVSARLGLTRGSSSESLAAIDEIVRWRRDNQPGGQNAGSVFVNPVPGEVSAGELIDRVGLRGFRIGTAEVSTKHANFIQADENGRAADVRAVMTHVHDVVQSATGFDLRSEVRLVGFAEDES